MSSSSTTRSSQALKISPDEVKAEVESEREELTRREAIYRGGRPPLDVRGKTVILIDDGLATGSTMRAAVAALRRQEPARIVVAVPVGAASTCAELQGSPTTASAPSPPKTSVRSDCGTRISPRPATTRCATCWPEAAFGDRRQS